MKVNSHIAFAVFRNGEGNHHRPNAIKTIFWTIDKTQEDCLYSREQQLSDSAWSTTKFIASRENATAFLVT
jgi:hypothetical protein